DLRVRHAPRGEQEHLPLARGEGGELRGLLGDAAARIEVLEQLPGGRGGDDGRARVHRADRREQELRVGVLQEETARAGGDGARGGLVEVEGGEQDDARAPLGRVGGREDAPRRLDAVHDGHTDVHEHDVGARAGRERDALEPVARLPHELEVGLRADEHPDARAEERLVVDEGDADLLGHRAGSSRVGAAGGGPLGWYGSQAVTTKLSPSGPARSRPPLRLARSLIPAMPCPTAAVATTGTAAVRGFASRRRLVIVSSTPCAVQLMRTRTSWFVSA